jgi:hypothetical protein
MALLRLLGSLARKGIIILICHRHFRERRRLAGTVEVRAGDPAALARPTISSATEPAGGTAGAAGASRTAAEMKVAPLVVDVFGAARTPDKDTGRVARSEVDDPIAVAVVVAVTVVVAAVIHFCDAISGC